MSAFAGSRSEAARQDTTPLRPINAPLVDDASCPHVTKLTLAGPVLSVGVAQFQASEIFLVRQPHVAPIMLLPNFDTALAVNVKCVVEPHFGQNWMSAFGSALSSRLYPVALPSTLTSDG